METVSKQLRGYEFKTQQRVRLNVPGATYDGKEGTVMFQKNESLVIVKFDDEGFNRSSRSATRWHPSCLEKI